MKRFISTFIFSLVICTFLAGQAFALECVVTNNKDDRSSYSLRYIATDLTYNNGGNCSITNQGLNYPEEETVTNMVMIQTQETLDALGTTGSAVSKITLAYKAVTYSGGNEEAEVPDPITFYPTKDYVIGNITQAAQAEVPLFSSETNVANYATMVLAGNGNLGYFILDGSPLPFISPLKCASECLDGSDDCGSIYLRNFVMFTGGMNMDPSSELTEKESFFSAQTCFKDGGSVQICNGTSKNRLTKETDGTLDPFDADTRMSSWCKCANETQMYKDNDGDGYGTSPFTSMFDRNFGSDSDNSPDFERQTINGDSTQSEDKPDNSESSDSDTETAQFKLEVGPGMKFERIGTYACDDDMQWYLDNGYVDQAGDCDDEEHTAYPGAPELACDGIDNDCDGEVDEDSDCDGDGYTNQIDCDDNDPDVNPGAEEICDDNIDNDCDDLIDTADEDDCTTEEDPNDIDDDNDGYTENEGDCDDNNNAVYPDAPELCDGLDNDCYGDIDEDDVCVTVVTDVDGDGYDSIADGGTDCDDNNAEINPGATDACDDGIDADCDGADTVCSAEVCDDAVDNDEDGLTDCEDDDCDSYYDCNGLEQETDCTNAADDDADGFADCDDMDCAFDSACTGEGIETVCDDSIDNDNDGLTDADDTDCLTPELTEVGDTAFVSGGGGCGCDLRPNRTATLNQIYAAFAVLLMLAMFALLRKRVGRKS